MPYRNQATLEAWLAEFRALGYAVESLRVIAQDGEGGQNTGLVALRLRNATTSVYIQPATIAGAHWAVTFEAREEAVELTAPAVAALSADLAVVSALCSFLEAKANSMVAGS